MVASTRRRSRTPWPGRVRGLRTARAGQNPHNGSRRVRHPAARRKSGRPRPHHLHEPSSLAFPLLQQADHRRHFEPPRPHRDLEGEVGAWIWRRSRLL